MYYIYIKLKKIKNIHIYDLIFCKRGSTPPTSTIELEHQFNLGWTSNTNL